MNKLLWLPLILLIAIRYISTNPHYSNGQHLRITGKIDSEPIQYPHSQRIILSGLKMYLPVYPEVHYADKISVEGVVEDDQLKEIKIVQFEKNQQPFLLIRQNLIKFYKKALPEPHSSLVAGMTIGAKSNIPQDFWGALRNTGTAHVVVASGMNVSLVAAFLLGMLLSFLPRKRALPLTIFGIWIYAILCGFDAPIVRAALMGSIAFLAQELGRVGIGWRSLLISVFIMLISKPQWLTDLGFLLSFAATASLMVFNKRVLKFLKRVPEIIREDLSTTLAAQVGVLPILLMSFGQFNLLSPLINVLILWTVVPITMIGMVAGGIGLIYEPLGRLVLYIAYPLTWWFIKIIEIFS